tara:strand:+ start:486 stop:1298 length:813 start_codon:yes stop_codon:yes gene_type:complete
MTEQTTTPAPTTPASEATSPASDTPATPEAQASPAEASGVAQSGFDMAAWKAAGSNRTELPESMRGLYDHLSDDFAKRDSFNAVKELRSMIDGADRQAQQRTGVYDKKDQPEGQADIEKQVQARLAQAKNQQAVQQFRGDFETMLKAPIQVGEGHSFAFADKNELAKFVEYSRNVLNNGSISPMDLYKLYNFERILADTGEWKARQHEESLRKTATGTRSPETATTQAKTSDASKSSAGERDSNLTVEEIMQQKFPEIYGNMKAGNVRYG